MNIDKLGSLDMWSTWQNKVISNLPYFCADTDFVGQDREQAKFEACAHKVVQQQEIYDKDGKEKDIPFGALIRDTQACGRVSRMWLETNREIDFIKQSLNLKDLKVLDIGAGYGRLAAVLSKEVKSYSTVDAVEISASICRYYTQLHNAKVQVMNLTDLLVAQKTKTLPQFDLAINIHSWSECSYENVRQWLELLKELQVPYLFTITHGNNYRAWSGGDLKQLLEQYYVRINNTEDGLDNSPYNMWKRNSL